MNVQDASDQRSASTNIVLVTGSLQGGGSERVLSDMANYWARRNWRVTVATWNGPDSKDFYVLDPSVRRVWVHASAANRRGFVRFFSGIRRMREILLEIKPDVVLSFIDSSNVLTLLATLGLHMRVVVSERTNPTCYSGLSWKWKLLRKVLYPRADTVVAQTDGVAHWLEDKCGAHVRTIPNALRELPTVSVNRSPMILAVGRLDFAKGVDVLLRAFARIHLEFKEWSVTIVGEGPEKPALVKLCDDLGLNAKVGFVGPVTDIEVLMARAGLVVQSSRFEGFPNVVLEAMGMRAPVISANCASGPSEIIQDGENGRLVPVDDVAALAMVMSELISQPDMRRRIGDSAGNVRQRYQQGPIMKQWEACFFQDPNNTGTGGLDKGEASIER